MKKKRLLLIIVAVVIVVFIALGLTFGKSGESAVEYVDTAIVKQDSLKAFVNTSGVVTSKDSFALSPKNSGEIVEIFVHEGDEVKEGQALLKLDQTSILSQIDSTTIELEIAKESLIQIINKGTNNYSSAYKNAVISKDNALKSYENAKKLYEAGAGSLSAMENAESSYLQALNSYEDTKANYNNENANSDIKIQELRIESLENSLASLNTQLEDTIIKSPIDGTITSDNAKLFSIVSPSYAVYTVDNLKDLIVTINVSQYDIHRLSLGQHVIITANGLEDDEYEGVIENIGSKAVSKVVGASQEMVIEVEIKVTSENTALKPNYSVKAEVETDSVENALVLPYEAVYINKNDEKLVFTVKDGQVTQHIVERGVEGIFDFQAITDTIQIGDHVILNPTEKITEEINVVERSVKK